MEQAVERVRTGGVTEAARDDAQGRFRRGDAVGFIDERLVAWGQPRETLEAVLAELARGKELVTVIEGADAPIDASSVAALVTNGAEVELERGDQPSWWWLVAAE
jgi:dihydroxyacetone kinase-like predicted kinase